jgi:effector-binding domain-containing protein
MTHEVVTRERSATLVLSKRVSVRLSGIGAGIGGAFAEVYGALGARRVPTAGPPFIIYHGVPVGDAPFDIEICAPVGMAAEAPAGWELQELPSGTFVSLVHVGPYDTIAAAYAELTSWVGDHDLAMAGPPREVYLSGPETPPAQVRTVVEYPVVPRPSPVPA